MFRSAAIAMAIVGLAAPLHAESRAYTVAPGSLTKTESQCLNRSGTAQDLSSVNWSVDLPILRTCLSAIVARLGASGAPGYFRHIGFKVLPTLTMDHPVSTARLAARRVTVLGATLLRNGAPRGPGDPQTIFQNGHAQRVMLRAEFDGEALSRFEISMVLN